jgi:hypothetical protein
MGALRSNEICGVLGRGIAVFVFSLALHVIAWRIRKPEAYREWLPALVVIFGPVAAIVAWLVSPTPLDLAALLLLHGTLACVYIIGYTLISAFSPSVELLKLLDRTPAGMAVASLRLPFLAGALTTDRIDNLIAAGLAAEHAGRLQLGPRGVWLTRLVLIYRHAIGLPDGGGG